MGFTPLESLQVSAARTWQGHVSPRSPGWVQTSAHLPVCPFVCSPVCPLMGWWVHRRLHRHERLAEGLQTVFNLVLGKKCLWPMRGLRQQLIFQ